MKRILERVPLFWLLQLGGWGVYAVLLIGTIIPFSRLTLVYHEVALLGEFGSSVVLHQICRRMWRFGLGFPRSLLVVLVSCAGLGYATTALGSIALHAALRSWNGLFPLLDFPGTIFTGSILVSWCALYFGIKYYQQVESERWRALVAENAARDAELCALRYQIHPRDEISFTEQYLEIEKLRFGHRLQIKMDVDTSISDCLVPYLILQPWPKEGGCRILLQIPYRAQVQALTRHVEL